MTIALILFSLAYIMSFLYRLESKEGRHWRAVLAFLLGAALLFLGARETIHAMFGI